MDIDPTTGTVAWPCASKADALDVWDSILSAVKARRKPAQPFLLYVSGIDASGKTTFSSLLAEHLIRARERVQIIHIDDFHNPKAHRYDGAIDPPDQYYALSFDLAKLVCSLLLPIRTLGFVNKTLSVLDLETDAFTKQRQYVVNQNTIVILEGVFLRRPILAAFCDLFVQIEVPLSIAYERAKARDMLAPNGIVPDKYVSKYFPAQLRYIRAFQPARGADIVIDNSDFRKPKLQKAQQILSYPGFNDKTWRRRFSAVCFDLWNTLVPLPATVKENAFRATAETLGIDPEYLRPLWARHRQRREICDLRRFLNEFVYDLGITSSSAIADEVIKRRRAIHGALMNELRMGAELTLRMLREAGYRTALISNCTSDVPDMVAGSSIASLFDIEVYSCREGIAKPDRSIFLRASTMLNVSPKECLYVGDGNDDELNGAALAGMVPILLETTQHREWNGLRISELTDLFSVLDI